MESGGCFAALVIIIITIMTRQTVKVFLKLLHLVASRYRLGLSSGGGAKGARAPSLNIFVGIGKILGRNPKAEADLECCKHMCRRAKKQLLLEKYYKTISLNSPS